MLEEFSKYFAAVATKDKDNGEGPSFWHSMLTGAIPEYLSIADASKSVKGQAAVCDWMSNMGNRMFEVQQSSEQIYAKTVLIGNENVK